MCNIVYRLYAFNDYRWFWKSWVNLGNTISKFHPNSKTHSFICMAYRLEKPVHDLAPADFSRMLSWHLFFFTLCSSNSKLLDISWMHHLISHLCAFAYAVLFFYQPGKFIFQVLSMGNLLSEASPNVVHLLGRFFSLYPVLPCFYSLHII